MLPANLALPLTASTFALYQERVYRDHKTKILELCGIKKFDDSARELITKEVTVMVRSQLKPRHIFQQVLDILLRNGIEVPSYHSLVEVIGGRMADYKKDLVGYCWAEPDRGK